MCGRYVNAAATGDLVREFEVDDVLDDDPEPSWNIAPTDPVRVVVERPRDRDDPASPRSRQLRTVRWGLVPSWSRDRRGAARMINARVETVTAKPAFAAAAARRRCLVPAQGYYEWQRTATGKQPWYLHDDAQPVLAMAGLYELWRDPERAEDDPLRWLWSCTVITRPATDTLGEIHDRCPVLVPDELRASWLDCTADDAAVAQRLLDAMPEPHLQPRRVSAAVGNVRVDRPDLIDPVDPEDGAAPPVPAADPVEPQQLSLDL